ncbi:sensor histidine kinase [Hymenobacter sp. GOD-10R]|uniref:PAS domain-containing sensor histidine kinase n=1 Tax=Hymenobacter sp. GOD-10R TaxID=3093922 RepID=UPI002D7865EB|nr:sensor histidine kinase [Hymenobacter sp. GOD-10R]WRQ31640.1 sensor histidine kinase [Hymenobacter sp. GOD-10R]
MRLFAPLITHSKVVYFAYAPRERQFVYLSDASAFELGNAAGAVVHNVAYWLTRVHPDDRFMLRRRFIQVLREQRIHEVEVRVLLEAERLQWFSLTLSRVSLGQDQQYLSGSVVDITQAKEMALHTQRFLTKKDATLEILAHDLAAPLTQIQQLTEHLRAETLEMSASTQHLLQLMERTCTDGVKLIRDFVDHEFLESANVELKRERADLVAWLELILHEYQLSQQHLAVQFSFSAAERPIYASLDLNKFQQVLNNLLSNALKFTPDGGQVTVQVERRQQQAVVTVRDTGIGIPAQWQPVLFERFTQARRTGLRGEKSTGLGMSIIQLIVKLHQGQISVVSREGQGTTFSIELPALLA